MFYMSFLLLSLDALPLLLASLLTLIVGGVAYLFLTLKVEVRLIGGRSIARTELEGAVRAWTTGLEELRLSLNETEQARRVPAPQSAEPESLTLSKLASELNELRARLNEMECEQRHLTGWTAEPEFLNLNRRAQVLGLYRKGKRVPEIASALHIPRGEVELMIKVHELSQSASLEIHSVSSL